MTEETKFKSPTEKINEALGIEPDGSIDDVLKEFEDEMDVLADGMKNTVAKIDNQIVSKPDDIHTLTQSLGELSDLIGTSKNMLRSVYDYVTSSDILDPDVIGSGADLIKACNELGITMVFTGNRHFKH